MTYTKEEKQEYDRQYRLKYKSQIKKNRHRYSIVKSNRISKWRTVFKIIETHWDLLYSIYKKTKRCDICNIKLIEGSMDNDGKCLDHDHKTLFYRGILCRKCNFRDDKGL